MSRGIEVGRDDFLVSIATHSAGRLVVGEQEDNVRFRIIRSGKRGQLRQEQGRAQRNSPPL
jgi:hypothetical protein